MVDNANNSYSIEYEVGAHRPNWVGVGIEGFDPTFSGKPVLNERDLFELYKFFVLETPCMNLSALSAPLSSRGWGEKPWSTKGIKKEATLRYHLFDELGLTKK